MGLLDYLCYRVRFLSIVSELHSVIILIEVFINWQGRVDRLVHLMIVKFEIRGHDLSILTKNVINKIAARDSKEDGVLIFQLLWVRVFDSVYALVLEGFIHCFHILVDYVSFIMLKLDFLL